MNIKNLKFKNRGIYIGSIRKQGKPFRYMLGSFLQITGLSRLISFRINDSKFPFSNSVLGLNFFIYKTLYLEECKRFIDLVQEGNTVVDIGANVGFLAIPAAQKVKTGNLVAVEAHPRTFGLLKENIQKNQLSNIKYFNLAVGEKAGEISFSDFSNDDINHVVANGKGIKIKMITLDELLEPITGDKIDILKIDVEGYEKFVLAGAKKTLNKTSIVYIEIGDENFAKFGYQSSDIVNQLEAAGFIVYTFNDTKQLHRIHTPFVQEKCINVLALKDAAAFCKNAGYTILPDGK